MVLSKEVATKLEKANVFANKPEQINRQIKSLRQLASLKVKKNQRHTSSLHHRLDYLSGTMAAHKLVRPSPTSNTTLLSPCTRKVKPFSIDQFEAVERAD